MSEGFELSRSESMSGNPQWEVTIKPSPDSEECFFLAASLEETSWTHLRGELVGVDLEVNSMSEYGWSSQHIPLSVRDTRNIANMFSFMADKAETYQNAIGHPEEF